MTAGFDRFGTAGLEWYGQAMTQIGKLIILCGAIVIVIGAVVWGLGRLGFRGLPGDVRYESEHVRFYFPIVTCLVLSALLTFGQWIWRWFSQR